MGPRLFSRGNRGVRGGSTRLVAASMGPRLFSRGNEFLDATGSTDHSGFNGAATFQPRKSIPPRAELRCTPALQWGRDFSAAEIPRTLRPDRRRFPALQWGRDFSAAEMRPGPVVGGVSAATSFNGAATFQPRKSARRSSDSHRAPLSFNGAATFQPRKCSCGLRSAAGRRQLQWGRDFSAAEMSVAASGRRFSSRRFNGAATFQPRK